MPLSDAELELNAHPRAVHQVPVLSRLLGLYRLDSHPTVVDDPDGTPEEPLDVPNGWEALFKPASDRLSRYRIFDDMDNGLVSSILDTWSEETTQPDYETGKTVWVESSNEKIKTAVSEMLTNVMVEDKIAGWARSIAKKGDKFERMLYSTGKGVLATRHAPAEDMTRIEDKFGRLHGFTQKNTRYGKNTRDASFAWDYIHFRMLSGKYEDGSYGTGVLDALFNPWRELTLMESSVLTYRLRRAPDRNLFLVDVGNMEEHEAMDYTNSWRKRLRKNEWLDPASPGYKKQYNPLNPLEDIVMPIRGANNTTRIESLSGSAAADSLLDLDHYRRKFFGASRVPQAFLGFEGDINAKATLVTQDVRFARGCKRLQRALVYGIRSMGDLHLVLKGDDYDFSRTENQYLIKMAPINALDEFERSELIKLRVEILDSMANLAQGLGLSSSVWASYLLLNYAKLPEKIVMRLLSKEPKQLKAGAPPVDTGLTNEGFTTLTESEQKDVARAVHMNPRLRKVLGDLAEYHIDDMAEQQTDPTMVPPKGVEVSDEVDERKEVRALQEALASLPKSKVLAG